MQTNHSLQGAFHARPLNLPSAIRVLERCDKLARCSETKMGLTRTFLSPAMDEAHELVAGWMRDAGLTPHVDEMGNLIGHYAAQDETPDSPIFLMGSHLDTVPNAGKYDGMLGVLLAIEAVANLEDQRLPFAIEVIGFSEEEGVRFKMPYLGSRAIAGSFDDGYLELRDQNGITMRRALRNFGLTPGGWQNARYDGDKILGYFEAHIEQGPYLESLDSPLGIVTDIAGQSRLRLRFGGEPGHAGTLPMKQRRDALTATSEWVLAVEAQGQNTEGLVATVGSMEVVPNTPNVVPGDVICTLDARHADNRIREDAVEALLKNAREIAKRRGVSFEILAHSEQAAVPMDNDLRRTLETVCAAMEVNAPHLVSGAGHDAAIMASLAPTAMLFLRSPGGVSHSPEEAVETGDVALALQVMHGFLSTLAGN